MGNFRLNFQELYQNILTNYHSGIELVDSQKIPLPKQTSYLVNRMKEQGILMSSDGPDQNVLKIKPPMVFSFVDAKELIRCLKIVLKEDFMTNY